MEVSNTTERLTVELLQDAFREPIPSVRLPLGYQLGLFLVTLAIVLLPILYLGLIAATGYAVYLHAVHNTSILDGGAILYRLLLYLGPMLIGCILIAFMIKPLFARQSPAPPLFKLNERDQPLLATFIDAVRRAVGAPAPRTIVIDCDVNASASFRRGLRSFLGNDMTLTIGLPLLAGMSMRQLGGILAHEFGHFSQGSGMRMTYLIRSVNSWFARAVYERDAWDERLNRWTQNMDFRIAIVLWLSQFMLFVTRGILRLLMLLGHAISTYMMRAMEYNADSYETRLVGSNEFEATSLRLRMLSAGSQLAMNTLARSWQDGRLCDNYPDLVVGMTERMSPDMREALANDKQPRSAYDTHPPDAERIAAAKRDAAPGVFHLERPASDLITDFPLFSREVTRDFYRNVQGLPVERTNLLKTEEYLQQHDVDRSEQEAAEQYLGGLASPLIPILASAEMPLAPESIQASITELQQSRMTVGKLRAAAKTISSREDTEEPSAVAEDMGAAIEELRNAVQQRLHTVLSLLQSPSLEAQLPQRAALAMEAQRYVGCVALFGKQNSVLAGLSNEYEAAGPMLMELSENTENEDLFNETLDSMNKVNNLMNQMVELLRDIPYPFEHAAGEVDVATFSTAGLPDYRPAENPGIDGVVLIRAGQFLERLFSFYARCICRLASIAREVESALESNPLPPQELPPQELPPNDVEPS